MIENTTFIVQANYYGWDGSIDYSLSEVQGKTVFLHTLDKIREISPETKIIIVVPNIKENKIFEKLTAKYNKVHVFKGSENNVLLRIVDACSFYKVQGLIIRILGQHMFFSKKLIVNMHAVIVSEKLDLIKPPNNFDIKFSGEIFTLDALLKLHKLLKSELKNVENKSDIQINPARYIASNNTYFTSRRYFKELASLIDEAEILKYRDLMKEVYKVDRARYNLDKANPLGNLLLRHYNYAIELVQSDFIVLDIACGSGFGARLMSKHAKHVDACDINEELIESLQNTNQFTNVNFEVQNAEKLLYEDDKYDIITGMETIEHIEDVDKYLSEMDRVLKPNGYFLCSTPQNAFGTLPLNPYHLREYSYAELLGKLEEYFEVLQLVVYNGTIEVIEGNIGSNMIAICRKK